MRVRALSALILAVLPWILQNTERLQAQSSIWVTAYYAGWSQGQTNDGVLPAQEIDYSAVTHIIHFALVPNTDGSIDSVSNIITQTNSTALLTLAHNAGKKVLISVGGWGTDYLFRGAVNDTNRTSFVANLVNFMARRGYDGIDVDWEYLDGTDSALYVTFIRQLRAKLDGVTPRPLLTAPVAWQPSIFGALQNQFDQINLMTYDLSSAWAGWISWHNAPIYDGGARLPGSGELVPSANGMVNDFLSAGISPAKLGIGIDFYGYVWSGGSGTSTGGVTAPRQTWTVAPQVQSNIPYNELLPNYYQPQDYRWDSLAEVSYLSMDNPGSANDKFISYDDELTCQAKVNYVRSKGIGGVIIWELGGGYLPSSYPNRDRLLQAVKQGYNGTVTNPPPVPVLLSPADGAIGVATNPTLSWNSSAGASFYRVRVSDSSSFSNTILDRSGIVSTSTAVTGLSRGLTYYWQANASSIGGTSSWSTTSSFTTVAPMPAPVLSAPLNNTTLTISDVTLQWEPISGAVSYQLQMSVDSNFAQTSVDQWTAETSYPLYECCDTTLYYWRVKAITVNDTSNWSAVDRFTLQLPRADAFIPVLAGWNIVSVPLVANDWEKKAIFPTALTGAFTYENTDYTKMDTLSVGTGYWMKFPADQFVPVRGTPLVQETVSVVTGWNMIGSIAQRLPAYAIEQIPAAFVTSEYYGFNRGYQMSDTIEPGRGYWVKTSQDGRLILSSASSAPLRAVNRNLLLQFSKLTIYDSERNEADLYFGKSVDQSQVQLYELPPPLPGVFDARFAGGSSLAIFSGKTQDEIPIVASSPSTPITLRWDVKPAEPTAMVVVGTRQYYMSDCDSIQIFNPDTHIALRFAGTQPGDFTLNECFPNPFNPTTTISFTVLRDQFISLKIYSLLGSEVATLANQRMKAGTYSVSFRGDNLPSGLYFCNLTGEKSFQTRKLLLLK